MVVNRLITALDPIYKGLPSEPLMLPSNNDDLLYCIYRYIYTYDIYKKNSIRNLKTGWSKIKLTTHNEAKIGELFSDNDFTLEDYMLNLPLADF